MLRFMSLSSGSCGNCYYLGTDNGGILIDAGVSLRRLKKALQEYELDTDSFSAVLVTRIYDRNHSFRIGQTYIYGSDHQSLQKDHGRRRVE